MSHHGQCPWLLELRTGTRLYCVEQEGHEGPHRPDPDAWPFVKKDSWQRADEREASALRPQDSAP